MNKDIMTQYGQKQKRRVLYIAIALVATLFLIIGWGLASGADLSSAPSVLLGDIKNAAGFLFENIADAGRRTFLGQKKRTLVKEIYFGENTRENNPTNARQEKPVTCAFETLQKPSRNKIILSEIAWMGTGENTNDEWIEIKNISSGEINISGWQVIDKDEQIKIIFVGEKLLQQNDILLLARKQKNEKNREADILYEGNLKNSDEGVRIFNSNCELQDEIVSSKWPAGDNKTKQTMERDNAGFGWHTSTLAGGTPRKENSIGTAKNETRKEKSSTQNNDEQRDDIVKTQTQPNNSAEKINESKNEGVQAQIQDNLKETVQQQSQEQAIENEQKNQQEEQVAKPRQDLKILISEVFAGSDKSAKDEFLELYNPNDEEVDLSGWSIKKKSSTGKESSLVSATRLEGKKIPPRKFFLIANEAGYAGHPSPDVVWPSSYTIAYTKNSIVVYNDEKEKVDETYWEEISKNKSIVRSSWDSNQFSVQNSPTPQNSRSQ